MPAWEARDIVPTAKNRPYRLLAYDPDWPRQFQAEVRRLANIFGPEAIRLEHMGSTSIPGMWAKPQIDILIEVPTLDWARAHYADMQRAGYVARGDYTKIGEEYFTKDKQQERLFSIHVLPSGHPEVDMILAFRNYLRANEAERDLYSKVKRQCQAKSPDNYLQYFTDKKQIIYELRKRAIRWAQNS